MRPAANAGLLPEEGMTRITQTTFLTLTISALLAASAVSAPLTVDEAVKMALTNSSQVVGAEAALLDARSGLYRSYAGVLPQVQLLATRNASIREQLRGTQSFSGILFTTDRQDFTGYTNSPTLSGTWNFLDLTSLENLSSARSGLNAANLSQKATRQVVALDARQKFYQVVKAIHLSQVSSEALHLARDNERRLRALFDVGSVARSDLLVARVQTAQGELDSLAKHNAILVTRITLATAMGIEEGRLGEVDTTLTAL